MVRPDGRASARKSLVFLAVGMVIFFFASVSSADVPDSINYQGKLTTASGGCLNDTVQMTFTIYADESGTVWEWSETQTEVVVKEGIFNVLLGSVNPLAASIFDGTAKYLGVQVESDPEMSPLKPMVTTAYAFGSHHAQEADTADYAREAPTASDGDWEFSGDDIYRLNGNVGIGTESSSGAKLYVLGGGFLLNSGPGGYYCRIDGNQIIGGLLGPPGYHHLHIKPGDNSSYLLLAEDGANVGIGTTSPSEKLHVEGNILGDQFQVRGNVLGYNFGGEINFRENDLTIQASANDPIIFNHGGTVETARIQANGNVGIGTDSPGARLHVVGGGFLLNTGPGGYYCRIDGNEIIGGLIGPPGTHHLHIKPGENSSNLLLAEDGGNVGIGTTNPQGALDVSSTTGAFIVPRMTTTQRNALTAVNGMIIYNTTTNQFNFYENGAWVTK